MCGRLGARGASLTLVALFLVALGGQGELATGGRDESVEEVLVDPPQHPGVRVELGQAVLAGDRARQDGQHQLVALRGLQVQVLGLQESFVGDVAFAEVLEVRFESLGPSGRGEGVLDVGSGISQLLPGAVAESGLEAAECSTDLIFSIGVGSELLPLVFAADALQRWRGDGLLDQLLDLRQTVGGLAGTSDQSERVGDLEVGAEALSLPLHQRDQVLDPDDQDLVVKLHDADLHGLHDGAPVFTSPRGEDAGLEGVGEDKDLSSDDAGTSVETGLLLAVDELIVRGQGLVLLLLLGDGVATGLIHHLGGDVQEAVLLVQSVADSGDHRPLLRLALVVFELSLQVVAVQLVRVDEADGVGDDAAAVGGLHLAGVDLPHEETDQRRSRTVVLSPLVPDDRGDDPTVAGGDASQADIHLFQHAPLVGELRRADDAGLLVLAPVELLVPALLVTGEALGGTVQTPAGVLGVAELAAEGGRGDNGHVLASAVLGDDVLVHEGLQSLEVDPAQPFGQAAHHEVFRGGEQDADGGEPLPDGRELWAVGLLSVVGHGCSSSARCRCCGEGVSWKGSVLYHRVDRDLS